MYDSEIRVAELTRALENLVECFVDNGDGFCIPTVTKDLVQVDPDVDQVLEHALNILYNEEYTEEDEEDRYLTEL